LPFAVIMAGGRGERFWPRSRMDRPKQFLKLLGDKTMLQLTLERLKGLVGITDTYVIAGKEFKETIREQAPHLPEENIIIEPFGRDTAAAVGLAALVLSRRDPHEVMVVLPADHYIGDVSRFREILKSAVTAAGRENVIVTLGITPRGPETGYGYIKRGKMLDTYGGIPAYRVQHFFEKPDYGRAAEFIASGDYLWNSGMFVWRVDLILELIEEFLPRLSEGLQKIMEHLGTSRYPEVLEEVYAGLTRISIDYGVLEHAGNVLVVPGDFGWDDIGCWTALEKYAEKDAFGNVLQGSGVLIDTTNSYVISDGKTVALLGVDDMIVVNDRDSLMICRKDRAQEIKRVVQALRDKGFDDVL